MSRKQNKCQRTTSKSLKLKRLGGFLDLPGGACYWTDNPRDTSPAFEIYNLYTIVVSLPPERSILKENYSLRQIEVQWIGWEYVSYND